MILWNKTILIAGASSGIGRRVALQLAGKNNRLIIFARRKDQLESLAEDILATGSKVLLVAGDALSKEQAEAAVSQGITEFGRIDAALLNVGDGPAFNMSKTGVDDVLGNMDLNYATMVNFLMPLIAQMKSQGGGLIAHTNSLAGFLGLPMQGPYSAAKAACRILMDTCRIELKPFGLRFVSAYPGFVATERVAEDGIPAPFEISETVAARHIIKAMKRERADYLFPFITGSLIRLALLLPKSITGYLLSKSVPSDY
ncbi:SDR family NAD(P)-dependent oxidoreductase [uncultured Endozoicomonas sp.]|uniref:SDR family NAD(P)-dependent oxidoreductase n=1 Tax=uncultured Endozoicomonas sp. TaxID=432652 RepID=UPI002625800A|nr:SDR family NAD(P)-dependent oxidoreductase [uncultured Endozoicomonas sp.]